MPTTTAIQTKWSETTTPWVETQFTWGERATVIEVAQVLGRVGMGGIATWQKEQPEKKKKLIKLYCKVMGEKYEESKYKEDFTLSVKQIKLVINEVLNKKKISVGITLNG